MDLRNIVQIVSDVLGSFSGANTKLFQSLVIWQEKAVACLKKQEGQQNISEAEIAQQRSALFSIFAQELIEPSDDALSSEILLLFPKVFTHQDILACIALPEFKDIKSTFEENYFPTLEFVTAEKNKQGLVVKRAAAGDVSFFDVSDDAWRVILRNCSTKALMNFKNCSKKAYVMALEELFRREEDEALYYQEACIENLDLLVNISGVQSNIDVVRKDAMLKKMLLRFLCKSDSAAERAKYALRYSELDNNKDRAAAFKDKVTALMPAAVEQGVVQAQPDKKYLIMPKNKVMPLVAAGKYHEMPLALLACVRFSRSELDPFIQLFEETEQNAVKSSAMFVVLSAVLMLDIKEFGADGYECFVFDWVKKCIVYDKDLSSGLYSHKEILPKCIEHVIAASQPEVCHRVSMTLLKIMRYSSHSLERFRPSCIIHTYLANIILAFPVKMRSSIDDIIGYFENQLSFLLAWQKKGGRRVALSRGECEGVYNLLCSIIKTCPEKKAFCQALVSKFVLLMLRCDSLYQNRFAEYLARLAVLGEDYRSAIIADLRVHVTDESQKAQLARLAVLEEDYRSAVIACLQANVTGESQEARLAQRAEGYNSSVEGVQKVQKADCFLSKLILDEQSAVMLLEKFLLNLSHCSDATEMKRFGELIENILLRLSDVFSSDAQMSVIKLLTKAFLSYFDTSQNEEVKAICQKLQPKDNTLLEVLNDLSDMFVNDTLRDIDRLFMVMLSKYLYFMRPSLDTVISNVLNLIQSAGMLDRIPENLMLMLSELAHIIITKTSASLEQLRSFMPRFLLSFYRLAQLSNNTPINSVIIGFVRDILSLDNARFLSLISEEFLSFMLDPLRAEHINKRENICLLLGKYVQSNPSSGQAEAVRGALKAKLFSRYEPMFSAAVEALSSCFVSADEVWQATLLEIISHMISFGRFISLGREIYSGRLFCDASILETLGSITLPAPLPGEFLSSLLDKLTELLNGTIFPDQLGLFSKIFAVCMQKIECFPIANLLPLFDHLQHATDAVRKTAFDCIHAAIPKVSDMSEEANSAVTEKISKLPTEQSPATLELTIMEYVLAERFSPKQQALPAPR